MEMPMTDADDILRLPDASAWRAWLARLYSQQDSVWIAITRKGVEPVALQLGDAVEEALCFGWIDSTLRRIDDRSYALRFSPRRPGSVWSESNKRRVATLVGEGRMAAPGLAAIEAAKANGQWEAASRRERVDDIPPDLGSALVSQVGGVDGYLALRASRRKQLLYWLDSAKRPTTRTKRIQGIVDEVLSADQ
jgi:uncharacterized protein YdeI (YjbR/CyaY-like superfamily)